MLQPFDAVYVCIFTKQTCKIAIKKNTIKKMEEPKLASAIENMSNPELLFYLYGSHFSDEKYLIRKTKICLCSFCITSKNWHISTVSPLKPITNQPIRQIKRRVNIPNVII